MTTVWKFPLILTAEQGVMLPVGAELLCVQVQNGEPCLWAKVDSDTTGRLRRRLFIVGTGHEVPVEAVFYVATLQIGPFVGHVFTDLPL